MRLIFSAIGVLILFTATIAQQVADTAFNPVIQQPEYARGKGAVVAIDQGHFNFHTAAERYLPFARLLRADGYNVTGYSGSFTPEGLENISILVIANALNELNVSNWFVPTPSAFTEAEIRTVELWVRNGGSLFLIADHMPMGGAAADLAAAFGFSFTNGFAVDTAAAGPAIFTRDENTLSDCPVTRGRNAGETVDKIVTFTGQAFRMPEAATPVLTFSDKYLLLESDTAWVFNAGTRYTRIGGWSQGALLEHGKGRVVMFGEAAMFTAQLAGPLRQKVGMNSEFAEQNYQLLLNIIHWLDRKY